MEMELEIEEEPEEEEKEEPTKEATLPAEGMGLHITLENPEINIEKLTLKKKE